MKIIQNIKLYNQMSSVISILQKYFISDLVDIIVQYSLWYVNKWIVPAEPKYYAIDCCESEEGFYTLECDKNRNTIIKRNMKIIVREIYTSGYRGISVYENKIYIVCPVGISSYTVSGDFLQYKKFYYVLDMKFGSRVKDNKIFFGTCDGKRFCELAEFENPKYARCGVYESNYRHKLSAVMQNNKITVSSFNNNIFEHATTENSSDIIVSDLGNSIVVIDRFNFYFYVPMTDIIEYDL